MQNIRVWFEEQLAGGRAAQPSETLFPRASTLVTGDAAPASAREARDFYDETCFDWGGAWIHRQTIGADVVFFVHVGTDGDDGALEIFDAAGALIDTAFLEGEAISWEDRAMVRARFVR